MLLQRETKKIFKEKKEERKKVQKKKEGKRNWVLMCLESVT